MTQRAGFVFDGNLLCLDFVNTRMMAGGELVDRLTTADDLARWLRAAGVLASPDATAAVASWSRADADRVFRSAAELRSALRSALEPVASEERMKQRTARRLTDAVNEILATAPMVSSLHHERGEFRTDERVVGDDPRSVLAPVAASIRDLFADDRIGDVRQCSDPSCVIFFYDETKNHSRRWCSMERCGNRAKVAAYRRRARQRRRRSSNHS